MGDGYLPNTIGHQQITYKTLGNVTLQYAHNITFTGNTFSHLVEWLSIWIPAARITR